MTKQLQNKSMKIDLRRIKRVIKTFEEIVDANLNID